MKGLIKMSVNADGNKSVSYTHLDVYKRQVLYSDIKQDILYMLMQFNGSISYKKKALRFS